MKNHGNRQVFLRWEKGANLLQESEKQELILNSSSADYFS